MTAAGDRPEELAAKVVAAVDRLARGQRADRQATASRLGLTPLQAEVLRIIAEGPPPQPLVGLLALELGVSQPTVSESLRALERKGLLTRRADPLDARRTVVSLTIAGQSRAEDIGAADRTLVDAVHSLPRPEQEATLGTLLTLIAKLVEAGTIQVARTCLTCHFHEQDGSGGHRCTLLDTDLPTARLRVNCPEHLARTGS